MHSMRLHCRFPYVLLVVILGSLLAVPGCGGGGGSLTADPVTSAADVSIGVADPAEILAAADDVPDGVDPDVYRMLTSALAEMVADLSADRPTSSLPEGPAGYVRNLRLDISSYNVGHLVWDYANLGDYDQNTRVNISDITVIGYYYEMFKGDPKWNLGRLADGNHDGAVTVADLTAIGANYGNIVPYYAIYRSKDPQDYPLFNGGVPGPGAERIVDRYEGYRYTWSYRDYSYKISNPEEGWYYWVVPTDGSIEGQASNLAGGIFGEWPLVDSIEPAFGLPGTEVTLRGTGFGELTDDCRVELNDLDMEILAWEDDEIITVIPDGARDGMVRIHVGDILFADSPEYLVAEPPVVSGSLTGTLELGQPCELAGTNFLSHQGIGQLLIGGVVQPVAEWTDTLLMIEFLNPALISGDVVEVQVVASNGLSGNPVLLPANLSFGEISVEPLSGIPEVGTYAATEFTFTYEPLDTSQDYTVEVVSNYYGGAASVEDTYPGRLLAQSTTVDMNPAKPGVQFSYSTDTGGLTYDEDLTRYYLDFKFTNTSTGHTFVIDGPELRLINPQFNVARLDAIAPVDFGRDDIPAPNDICFNAADGTYIDFTFVDGVPLVTSSLTSFLDGDGVLPWFTRDPREFLKGGSDPRPFCYRGQARSGSYPEAISTMSLTGSGFGETPDYFSFRFEKRVMREDEYVGWDGNAGWTDTEVRIRPTVMYLGEFDQIYHNTLDYYNCRDNYVDIRYAPVVNSYLLEGAQVDLRDGLLQLSGSGFYQKELEGIFGGGLLTYWRVPVIYTSPWTDELVTKTELLVTPLEPLWFNGTQIYLRIADLDRAGDGIVTVEARSEDGTQACILDAALTTGPAEFFVWAGFLETGTQLEIANSGMFSETCSIELVRNELENQPPVVVLENISETLDVPTDVKLTAENSYDPDGQIVAFLWDRDGDGNFTESYDFSDPAELVSLMNSSATIGCDYTGACRFGVKVIDDRGAASIATIEIELVNEVGDYSVGFGLSNPEEFTDVADTTCQFYRGDPDSGGELIYEAVVEAVFDEINSSGYSSMRWSETLKDIPAGENYWCRLSNPDGDWRNAYDTETPLTGVYTYGPITIPDARWNHLHRWATIWR